MKYRTLLLLLPLATCAGPPTRYFTLTPSPPGPGGAAVSARSEPPDTRSGARPIVLHHVVLPETLDRLSFVTAGGDGRLDVSSQDLWAAPLDGMVQSVLASDLAARLPGEVLMPGDPIPPGGTRGLLVNLRQFIGDSAGRVILRADWSLFAGNPPVPVLSRSETVIVHAAAGRAGDLVPAMSRALGILGTRIAQAIRG